MFKYHSDMGHCFSVVMVSKKSKKKSEFFFFLNWGKRWLFSIGNGAKIRPLEMGRKSPERPLKKKIKNGFQDQLSLNAGQKYCRMLA